MAARLLPHSPPPSASLPAAPPPQMSPDDAEQQAAFLLACSGSVAPAPLPPISMYDLLEALQVRSESLDPFCSYSLHSQLYGVNLREKKKRK